jgi:8-oxo-dGTP pyrophosphatase MutT (NUDIX family)
VSNHEVSSSDLTQLLSNYSIAYETWGRAGTKTIDDLRAELDEGESTLEERDGMLVRKVGVVGLDVFADIDGVRHILCEDRQEFANDETVKHRHLSTSLGEKTRLGEAPRATMIRALREELGVSVPDESIRIGDIEYHFAASTMYPGLMSEKTLTTGVVLIESAHIRPEGYIEQQPTKSTYFVWKPLS